MAYDKLDILKRLENNPLFKAALASIPEEEQARVKAQVADFASRAEEALSVLAMKVAQDPKLAEAIKREVQVDADSLDELVIAEAPVSGSASS